MFTGIVRETGQIRVEGQSDGGATFEIRSPSVIADLELGDSLSVDGVCLTVAEKRDGAIVLEATPETLNRTNLGDRVSGDQVNLEPAAKLTDFLGGHLVQGHVDATGRVVSVREEGNSWIFRVWAPEEVLQHCAFKGSVTVNGVSLTISAIHPDGFEVTIIPHTFELTGFKELGLDDRVNLEADIISKYVESHVKRYLTPGGSLGALCAVFFLSSALALGADWSLGPRSVLVYRNEAGSNSVTQFVLRLARYHPDIFLEWESRSHQGTLHLHEKAVREAEAFSLSSLFEVGVDLESSDTMTVWLPERIYTDLVEGKKAELRLNRLPVTMKLEGTGNQTLTLDGVPMVIEVIRVSDNRGGVWVFHRDLKNPLLIEYKSKYFHQILKSISTSSANKLRWIHTTPEVK